MLAAAGRGRGELRGQGGLAGSGGAHDQRARAFLDAAAEQRVELRDAAGELRARRSLPMFRGDQPRKDLEPASADDVVVIATAKLHASVFDDAEPATLGAVLGIQLFEQHDAVRDALHLQVAFGRGQVVEQDDGAFPVAKYCFSARICRR